MLAFPTTPAIDEVYTYMGRSWVWNGVGWAYVAKTFALTVSDTEPEDPDVGDLWLGP